MSKKYRRIVLQIVLVIIAIIFIRFYQQQGIATELAPTFISNSINDKQIALTTNENNASLVHFWATWCGICALENSNIQNIIKDSNYNIINIAWQSGNNEQLIKYAEDNNLDINTIINDQYGTLANAYGVSATPSSFIIDKQGNIKFIEIGYTTELGLRLRLWWANL